MKNVVSQSGRSFGSCVMNKEESPYKPEILLLCMKSRLKNGDARIIAPKRLISSVERILSKAIPADPFQSHIYISTHFLHLNDQLHRSFQSY